MEKCLLIYLICYNWLSLTHFHLTKILPGRICSTTRLALSIPKCRCNKKKKPHFLILRFRSKASDKLLIGKLTHAQIRKQIPTFWASILNKFLTQHKNHALNDFPHSSDAKFKRFLEGVKRYFQEGTLMAIILTILLNRSKHQISSLATTLFT